jgi:hypothetical protein
MESHCESDSQGGIELFFVAQYFGLMRSLGVCNFMMIGTKGLHMIEESQTILTQSFGWTVMAYKLYWADDPFIFACATGF